MRSRPRAGRDPRPVDPLVALPPLPPLPVAVIDLRRRIIPNGLNLALLLAGLLVAGLRDPGAGPAPMAAVGLVAALVWSLRAVWPGSAAGPALASVT